MIKISQLPAATALTGVEIAPVVQSSATVGATIAQMKTYMSGSFAPQTSGTALLKGNGTGGFSNAVAGTDFVAPGLYTGSSLTVSTSGKVLGRLTGGTGAAEEISLGTSANNIVQLNGSAQLPAVDGSLLTGISSGDPAVQDFRLTLTTGTPVTSSDVAVATTIYCTPYKGNRIGLYNGSAWNIRTSAEFSLALGTLTSGLPYDVFCYDNAGTPTLEFLAWTSVSARATALAYQDGVLVKSGAATRRYLGTFYTISTTQTCDSSTAGRYLWNYYNRVRRPMRKTDATATWTYTTATYRQANNSTANQIEFVVGVAEDSVDVSVISSCANSAGTTLALGIGIDSTTVNSAIVRTSNNSTNTIMTVTAQGIASPLAAGRHYLAWLEWSTASGTTTWYGTNGEIISGIQGSVMA